MTSKPIFRYKFTENISLDDIFKIKDQFDFNLKFLDKPLKFKFDSEKQGKLIFILPDYAETLAGEHQLSYSNQKSLYTILYTGVKELFKSDEFQYYTTPIFLNYHIPNDLISISIDEENTIRVLIGYKKIGSSKFRRNQNKIYFKENLFKKSWFDKSRLKESLEIIFENKVSTKKRPTIQVVSNYREGFFIVITESDVNTSQINHFIKNAKKLGVKMTKIGESPNEWPDFLLEDVSGFALSDEFYFSTDYASVELDPPKEARLSDQPELKEIIRKFIEKEYYYEYYGGDLYMAKGGIEVRLINEENEKYQRFRLCIYGIWRKDLNAALELGGKIVESYGYHRGRADSNRDEHEDEWYKYVRE